MNFEQFAPDSPSSEDLRTKYPLDKNTELSILNKRNKINKAISSGIGNMVIIGPCAFYGTNQTLHTESDNLATLENETGLIVLQRQAIWKPRSKTIDWHGPETTDPEEAYSNIHNIATKNAHGASEIGHYNQIERYGSMLSMIWFGARNNDTTLKKRVAEWDHSLPIGIKNSIYNPIEQAIAEVNAINSVRGNSSETGQAILIYRGGKNAQNPEDWEKNYLDAYEQTKGKIIVDSAHGGEMAFDPKLEYRKSIEGQKKCLEKISELCLRGYRPLGIMTEASDTIIESPEKNVDPNMPFDEATHILSKIGNLDSLSSLR